MPPKDTQLHNVFVSTDGGETYSPLGKVSDVELTGVYIEGEEGQEMVAPDGLVPWGMIEFIADFIDRRTLLSIITGRKITNNWLKMHGYPMCRKRKGARKKK